MKPVVQLEPTGCGIASAAAIAGVSYPPAQHAAAALAISADAPRLWSDAIHMRALLRRLGYRAEPGEQPFTSWKWLPGLALLAIKWRAEQGVPRWHWVVFVRDATSPRVLDSRRGLKSNVRTDFGRMKPRWFIPVRRQGC